MFCGVFGAQLRMMPSRAVKNFSGDLRNSIMRPRHFAKISQLPIPRNAIRSDKWQGRFSVTVSSQ